MVAEINEQIVGTQAAMPYILMNKVGERYLTAKTEDSFVHPHFRGRGIFNLLYVAIKKEFINEIHIYD